MYFVNNVTDPVSLLVVLDTPSLITENVLVIFTEKSEYISSA
jgi:hypothetical protein